MPDHSAVAPASVASDRPAIKLLPVPFRPDLDSPTQVSLWERLELASEFSAYDPDAYHPAWVMQALRFPHSREWPSMTFVGVGEPDPVEQLSLMPDTAPTRIRRVASAPQDRPVRRASLGAQTCMAV